MELLADITVVMISAPPAPSRSTETSNMVTSAAPRSPGLFERRRFRVWLRGFIIWSSSLVNDRVAQNYVRGELYLSGALIAGTVRGADGRQTNADSDNDKLCIRGQDFVLIVAGCILHVGNVAGALGVDGRIVSYFFIVVAEDQGIDAIRQHGGLV